MTCLALLALVSLLGSAEKAHAQTVTFLNQSGQRVASWKDGDRITVVFQGGASNVRWVEVMRQTGQPGATPVVFYWSAYAPERGLRYTFTAYFPGYVAISGWFSRASTGPRVTGNTLWKNQR